MKSEQYLKEHKASGLKVGDKVKIIMKCPSYARGWDNFWNIKMTEYVGKTGIIRSDDDIAGFVVETSDGELFSYPYFVLEKVESDEFEYSRFGCHADAVKKIWLNI